MAVLLVAVWVVTFVAWLGTGRSGREGVLVATTVVTVAVLGITQVLSTFSALTLPWVLGAWLLTALAVMLVTRAAAVRGWERVRAGSWRPSDAVDWLVTAVLGGFGLATFVSAIMYPTTNYDSLTYHIPRVLFWFQNHSVARYPTIEGRQLFSGPLVEYVVLQLKVLSLGSDRLENLVQWAFYLVAIVAASLIAEKLGASRRGQQLVALAAAATPMAALQASTTQNDVTSAAWSLIAVYCVVALVRADEDNDARWQFAAWAGAALGLAVLAKPLAYITCAPFLVWLGIDAVRRNGWLVALRIVTIVVAVTLVINAAWYADNARLLGGDILGDSAPGMSRVLVQEINAPSLVTVGLENAALELGTPSKPLNARIATAVAAVVHVYGGDLNDPRTRESDTPTFAVGSDVTMHDIAPAPLTMALVALCIGALAGVGIRSRGPSVRAYVLASSAAFVLSACLINWNPYTNRLLVGSLLIFLPLVGAALTALTTRGWRVVRTALVIVLACAIVWGAVVTVFNLTNRVVSLSVVPIRSGIHDVGYWNTTYDELRFETVPALETPYKRLAAAVLAHRVERLGIDQHIADLPILPLLQLLPDRTFGYVGHTVLPGRLIAPEFSPQAVVEIVPADQYPAGLSSAARAGTQLVPAQRGYDWVFVLYRPR